MAREGALPSGILPSGVGEALQFEKAEFGEEPPSQTCAGCKAPLVGEYWEVNGLIVCRTCRDGIQRELGGGAGMEGFLRALGLGGGAAALGFGIYFAVLAITGYEIGLIGILVGYMVGRAVRKGSGGRGGRGFQVLAVFLTYTAICASYLASALREMETTRGVDVLRLVPLSYAMPFLLGFENVIGWVIIGFALWEAWRINRRLTLQMSGPHAIAVATPPPAPG